MIIKMSQQIADLIVETPIEVIAEFQQRRAKGGVNEFS